MKKFKQWFPVILIGIFFLSLLIFRNDLLQLISHYQQQQLSLNQSGSIDKIIHNQYNYEENGELFSYTFIEFGSTRCAACKKMELVLEEVQNQFLGKVQVVFINVGEKNNQEMVKYYGIAAIPTQVLLDRSGKEFFRHTGYISKSEIVKQFK